MTASLIRDDRLLQGHGPQGVVADMNTARIRLFAIALMVGAAFLVLGFRTVLIALSGVGVGSGPVGASNPVGGIPLVAEVPAVTASRRDIVDRNGVILATSLETRSATVNPRNVADPDGLARALAAIIPERSEAYFQDLLASRKSFEWIARQLTPSQVVKINALGEPAIDFLRAEERVYPHGRLAAHVIGRTDTDGRGLSGFESYMDERLRAPGRLAEPVRLSLDVRVQYALTDELAGAMRAHQAEAAAGLVVDARTGEVLALVSLPDFDPNKAARANDPREFNHAVNGSYELGSIFKTFTMAAAFEHDLIKMDSVFDATKPMRVAGGHWIRDDHPEARPLTVPEIYVHSSNIGTAQIASLLGQKRQEAFLRRLGFLQRPSIELPGAVEGQRPGQWHEVETMTIGYGHGLAASPVQLAQAIATMVNGGRRVDATLLRQSRPPAGGAYVISEPTSRKVRQMMRLAVRKGTGGAANAAGYRVGGKTGTAEMAVAGGYDRGRLLSSFVGAFPMDDPRYVVFAMLKEPKGNESTLGYAAAGWTAAPVVGHVVSRIAPLMGLLPEKEDQGLYQTVALLIKDED